MTIKLVADINKVLNAGKIDVVDRGEVQDDSLECGPVVGWIEFLSRAWARVIPWTILRVELVNGVRISE
jgi:hypothetical protein